MGGANKNFYVLLAFQKIYFCSIQTQATTAVQSNFVSWAWTQSLNAPETFCCLKWCERLCNTPPMKVGVVNFIWNNDSVCNTLQVIIVASCNHVCTFYVTAYKSSTQYDIKVWSQALMHLSCLYILFMLWQACWQLYTIEWGKTDVCFLHSEVPYYVEQRHMRLIN